MRKSFILLVTFFCVCSIKAQMVLKNTIELVNGGVNHFSVFNVTESTKNSKVVKYYSINRVKHTIDIFSSDGIFEKNVPIVFPEGYKYILNVSQASTKAFNIDDKVELTIVFRNSDYKSVTQIINEDGELIKSFTGYDGGIPYIFDNELRVNISYLDIDPTTSVPVNKTEIYTLGGNVPTGTSLLKTKSQRNPYPNPSSTIVNLPYNLKEYQSAVLRIFNSSGNLIDTKQIEYYNNDFQLDVSSYNPGVYVYEYNGITNRFIVK